MAPGDVFLWFERITSVLSQLMTLWDAVQRDSPEARLSASLELVRAMKRRQAAEAIADSR